MAKEKENTTTELKLVRCVWGLLCSLSSIDQEKKNISLFNVIEQLNIPQSFFSNQSTGKI